MCGLIFGVVPIAFAVGWWVGHKFGLQDVQLYEKLAGKIRK
jgi:hypothetical protein